MQFKVQILGSTLVHFEQDFGEFMMSSICYLYFSVEGYVLDGFPSLCEDWLPMADQLELVKNLPLTPDFIINLKVTVRLSLVLIV